MSSRGPAQHIASYAEAQFSKLAVDNYLRDLSLEAFVAKLAYYHAEINEMHPFREGNGRAQRAFLRQLAAAAAYRLDWTVVDEDENIRAAVAAHEGNLAPLTHLLRDVVRPA